MWPRQACLGLSERKVLITCRAGSRAVMVSFEELPPNVDGGIRQANGKLHCCVMLGRRARVHALESSPRSCDGEMVGVLRGRDNQDLAVAAARGDGEVEVR